MCSLQAVYAYTVLCNLKVIVYLYAEYSKFYIAMEKHYVSPEMEILEIQAEGVLCASNELLEEYEGEW